MNRGKFSRKAESRTQIDHFKEQVERASGSTKRAVREEAQQGQTARGHRTVSTLAQRTDRASAARSLGATTATLKRVRFCKGPLPHTPDGHPPHEGCVARAVRVLDRGPRGRCVTKRDVLELEELWREQELELLLEHQRRQQQQQPKLRGRKRKAERARGDEARAAQQDEGRGPAAAAATAVAPPGVGQYAESLRKLKMRVGLLPVAQPSRPYALRGRGRGCGGPGSAKKRKT